MPQIIADNLTADGYRVLVASDRAKAMALLTTAHPDLILVDVNGQTLGLLDAVRSGEGVAGRVNPDTPLIVLSRDAWLSNVRVRPNVCSPQTPRSNSARVNTLVGSPARVTSRSYSFAESSTVRSNTRTSRERTSIAIGPARMIRAPRRSSERLSTAAIRARSSG